MALVVLGGHALNPNPKPEPQTGTPFRTDLRDASQLLPGERDVRVRGHGRQRVLRAGH